MVLLSLIQPFFNLIVQTYGVRALDVTAVAFLTALSPVFSLIAARLFLKERISPKQLFFSSHSSGGQRPCGNEGRQRTEGSDLGHRINFTVFNSAQLIFHPFQKTFLRYRAAEPHVFSDIVWGHLLFRLRSAVRSNPSPSAHHAGAAPALHGVPSLPGIIKHNHSVFPEQLPALPSHSLSLIHIF